MLAASEAEATENDHHSTEPAGPHSVKAKPPPSASKLKPPSSSRLNGTKVPPFTLPSNLNSMSTSTADDEEASATITRDQSSTTTSTAKGSTAVNDSKKDISSSVTIPTPSATSSLKRKASDDNASNNTNATNPSTAVTARNTRARTEPPGTLLRKPVTSKTTTASRTVTAAKPTVASKGKRAAAPSAGNTLTKNEDAGGDAATSGGEPKKKKRPAWDLKGRLQDLEDEHVASKQEKEESKKALAEVTEKLDESNKRMHELVEFRYTLENKVQVKERENSDMAREISDLKYECQSLKIKHEDELSSLRSRHNREMEDLRASLASTQRNLESTQGDLKVSQQENLQLRATVSSQSAAALSIDSECRMLKLKVETTEDAVRIRGARIADLEKQLADKTAECCKMESKVREEETLRRKLHNTIQELKGNIRVFCRVRPPLDNEVVDKKLEEVMSHISFPESDEKNAIELSQLTENVQGSKPTTKSYPFTFDRVFQPKITQGQVFDEISQLVQSALDGYPVCIFAYGQTGSGKTFTMEGPDHGLEDEKSMGMIPRAVLQIFESAETLEEKGWAYSMEAQFMEIYNETIRDLLAPKHDDNRKHEIKHDNATGRTSVTDMTTVVVNTPRAVQSVLKKASHNRAVGATQCNERSSRSHSVFILKLTGHNSVTDEASEGVLNLIDLAGSERLSASGSTGDRLKETQAINKSLACLGDVIFALANKDQHIPYRNSKLTYLLQNSLGGNSKTLMFVNVSPLSTNFNETLNSLRFATKVNSCQIGTARKQIKMN
ncbi:hypothetical protein SeLEV6574_g06469 [Synchytrium endobioticum]|uniref:Kinesin-like protein n=1 Tax=Synchytrium endobioticum TaxID=286115 RepID=A0A507CNK9_9FUNG|nr:hypothetical protein SeLEV6574_g06469 [Synchytrium endobioticum]